MKISTAVWHLAPLPVHEEELQAMIILPECTYANDCTAVSYTHLDVYKRQPMSRPIVVYTVISSFLVPWMDFVYAKMILNAGISSKYTVAVGLFKMLDKSLINSYFTQFCAGGVLVSIPISILFIIMQKFYVEGITGGAEKG